jgi:hypothetical protein
VNAIPEDEDRCTAREGDGVCGYRCELPVGHDGPHACPEAAEAHDQSRGIRVVVLNLAR